MSINPSDIFITVVGGATIIITALALFYFNKIAKILRGGKGWHLFRWGAGMYLLALIVFAVMPTLIGKLISDSCLIIGAIIFIYALMQIHHEIRGALK